MAFINLQSFTIKINRSKGEIRRKFLARRRKAVFSGIEVVVDATPVKTGLLQSNWKITLSESLPSQSPISSREEVLSTAKQVLRESTRLGDIISVGNPVKYSSFVNDGNGAIPGVHMLERGLLRLEEILNSQENK